MSEEWHRMRVEKITLKEKTTVACNNCRSELGHVLMRGCDVVVWRCGRCGKLFEINIV